MDTGTDHIAITIRCFGEGDLTFGRAVEPSKGIAFLNADIRLGRTRDQKRRLSLAVIDELGTRFGVPREAVYVILTEHDGEHFQLSDRVLPSWSTGEDPLADPAPRPRRKVKLKPAGEEGGARRRSAGGDAMAREDGLDPGVLDGRLSVVQGDITRLDVDAIVNAANALAARRRRRGRGHPPGGRAGAAGRVPHPGRLPHRARRGSPRGYRLPARHVIHAVGPVWRGGGAGEDGLLASRLPRLPGAGARSTASRSHRLPGHLHRHLRLPDGRRPAPSRCARWRRRWPPARCRPAWSSAASAQEDRARYQKACAALG